MNKKIVIIGAGIAGLTLAIRLKKFGMNPLLFEEHEEPELIDAQDKKSVNITISHRGMQALGEIGCANEVRVKSMDIIGRTHFINGESYFTPFLSKEGILVHLGCSRDNLH